MIVPFAILLVWGKGKDHFRDSYFCMINLKGINGTDKHHAKYLDVLSAIKPISHTIWLRNFLFMSQKVTYNIALISNLVT